MSLSLRGPGRCNLGDWTVCAEGQVGAEILSTLSSLVRDGALGWGCREGNSKGETLVPWVQVLPLVSCTARTHVCPQLCLPQGPELTSSLNVFFGVCYLAGFPLSSLISAAQP